MKVELEKVLKIFDEQRQQLRDKMDNLYKQNCDEAKVELEGLLNAWSILSTTRNLLLVKITKENLVECDESDF